MTTYSQTHTHVRLRSTLIHKPVGKHQERTMMSLSEQAWAQRTSSIFHPREPLATKIQKTDATLYFKIPTRQSVPHIPVPMWNATFPSGSQYCLNWLQSTLVSPSCSCKPGSSTPLTQCVLGQYTRHTTNSTKKSFQNNIARVLF